MTGLKVWPWLADLTDWLDFWPTDSVLKCHGDEERERESTERGITSREHQTERDWAGDTNAAQHNTRHEGARPPGDSGLEDSGVREEIVTKERMSG